MQMTSPGPRDRGSIHGLPPTASRHDSSGDEFLLVQELTHRIKNELASTMGFVSLVAARSGNDEVKLALSGVLEHIYDFAGVYKSLQMPASDHLIDAADYLRTACRSISRARLRHKDVQLVFAGSPLTLTSHRCWRLGMIASELITNASRHAFAKGGGRIQVALASRGGEVSCAVADNGPLAEHGRPGLGMKIVRSLAHDLNGTLDHQFGALGTIATVSFPLFAAESEHQSVAGIGAGVREAVPVWTETAD
jgi:two-component sensor histidine kinase